VVVTEVFANLASIAARARGMMEVRTLILPHPLETRPQAEIEKIARDCIDTLHALLTTPAKR
jgi:hypothetical protein